MKTKPRESGLAALKAFLMAKDRAERERFAQACDTSVQHLMNIAYGCKPCAEKLAINIERESAAVVLCEDLREDVDWSYLRGTRRAKATA